MQRNGMILTLWSILMKIEIYPNQKFCYHATLITSNYSKGGISLGKRSES